ncbi:MAG: aldehyde dehydrogenase family protein, partial [Myxococcota bacterium]
MKEHGLFVDGGYQPAASGATYPSIDPATGEPWALFASAGVEDVDRAVAAAQRAHAEGTWRTMSGAQRAAVLRDVADLFVEHQETIVMAEVVDSGATLRKGNMADIPGAVMAFQHFADRAEAFEFEQVSEEFAPVPSRNIIRYEPIGVVAAIIPFNFPFAAASWKIAPALAAGCPIILKRHILDRIGGALH